MCAIFALTTKNFLAFKNFMNIVRQTSVIAVLSIGMTYVILTGGIDLSIGSNIALSGAIAVIVLQSTGSTVLSLITAIVVGILVGVVNGFMIGKLRISAFIASLAMMSSARGLTMMVTNAGSIRIENQVYTFISQKDIFGIPFVFFIVLIMFFIFAKINSSFLFGKQVYAIGGNPLAAKAMGINVERVIMKVYMLQGGLAGLGAILTVGRVSSAQPWAGLNVEFEAITAVVLGGTSLMGGIGSIYGTVFGAILVGVISNGLGLMSISSYFEFIVKGMLILIAVFIDVTSLRLKENKLTPVVEKDKYEKREEPHILHYIKTQDNKVLEMKDITKAFPGMKALEKVNLTIRQGEVHALMGENGAGKSTLMKILAGEVPKSSGQITINGKYIDINSPIKSAHAGIAIIHQEFSLVRELTVAQNIFLGEEIKSNIPGFVSKKKMHDKANELIKRLGIYIDVELPVKELTVSQQQMVEIAKALHKKAWLLIMDEPTSALTEEEKDTLFNIINKLKQEKVGIVYISHRMQEIFDIADVLTVLRDGKFVGTNMVEEIDEVQIIKMMVGRGLSNVFDREKAKIGGTVIRVENLTRNGFFNDITFEVHEGEVLGLSGLMGAGRTEIARCIFGLDKYDSGNVYMYGKKVRINNPQVL